MKYKYFDHTADAMFQAYGKTLEEAFSNAALATMGIMVDIKKVKPKRTIKVTAKGKELRNLLYDFIEAVIVLTETESFVLNKVKSLKISKDNKLTAELVGDHYKNYDVHTPIKAMTYSDMKIEQKKGSYTLQVVVDI